MLHEQQIVETLVKASLVADEDYTMIGRTDNVTEIHFDERLDINGCLYLLREHCKPHTFTNAGRNIVKIDQ